MLTEIITPPLSFPFKTQLHTPSIEQYLNYFQFFLPDFQNQFPKKGKNLIQCLSIYWVLFLSPFWMWTGRKYLPSHYQRTEWQKYSTLSLWVWKGSRYSQSFPLSVLDLTALLHVWNLRLWWQVVFKTSPPPQLRNLRISRMVIPK